MKQYFSKVLVLIILIPFLFLSGWSFVVGAYYDGYGAYDSYGYGSYDSYDYGSYDSYGGYGSYDSYGYGSYDSYGGYGSYDDYGFFDNYGYDSYDYGSYDSYGGYGSYDDYGFYDNYNYGNDYYQDYNSYDNYDVLGDFFGDDYYGDYNYYDGYTYQDDYYNDYNYYDNYNYGDDYYEDYNYYDGYTYQDDYYNDYNYYDNYNYGDNYYDDYNYYDGYNYGDDYYQDYGYYNEAYCDDNYCYNDYYQNDYYPVIQPPIIFPPIIQPPIIQPPIIQPPIIQPPIIQPPIVIPEYTCIDGECTVNIPPEQYIPQAVQSETIQYVSSAPAVVRGVAGVSEIASEDEEDIIIEILARPVADSEDWKESFEIMPGQEIEFLIILVNSRDKALENVNVKVILPAEIDYKDDLKVKQDFYDGDITQGINIDSLSPGIIKMITFKGEINSDNLPDEGKKEMLVQGISTVNDSSASDSLTITSEKISEDIVTGQEVEQDSIFKKWYIWLLIALIVVFLIFIFKKLFLSS